MAEPRAETPAMSDYGVGGDDWEALPWSWAAQRLAKARNHWIVTTSADGRPHAMPVWGVWSDDDHAFFFSTSPNSRKVRNLTENPRVVIASEDTVECISIEGTAALVTDDARRELWIDRYMDRYLELSPEMSRDFLRSHTAFEITPERAFGIIETEEDFARRATRWIF